MRILLMPVNWVKNTPVAQTKKCISYWWRYYLCKGNIPGLATNFGILDNPQSYTSIITESNKVKDNAWKEFPNPNINTKIYRHGKERIFRLFIVVTWHFNAFSQRINNDFVKMHKLNFQGKQKKTILNWLTKRSEGFPSLNRMKVGKASILYVSAIWGYFSVSILTTWILSFRAAPTSLRIGAMYWQGPHLQTISWVVYVSIYKTF